MSRRELVIRLDRTAVVAVAVVVFVGVLTLKLYSESLTMTASYPAPVGVYNQLVTTGDAGAVPADTTLNRNAGNAILAPGTNASGKVGVGTSSPTEKLTVSGNIVASGKIVAGGTVQLGTLAADPVGVNGMMYYNSTTGKIRAYQNDAWSDFGASGSTAGQYYTATCVATDGNGCTATIGTAGLVTTSKTSTWSDSSHCFSAGSPCYFDSAPGCVPVPPMPQTINCTATNTPIP